MHHLNWQIKHVLVEAKHSAQFVEVRSACDNAERMKQDIKKICSTEISMFDPHHLKNYTFITMATGNSYGGLEHPNSTSLISPREDLPKVMSP